MKQNKSGKRVLITGAGGSAGVNFTKSLFFGREHFYTIGTDTSKFYIKLSKCHKNYVVPTCEHPEYISNLNKIIKEEKIDFVHAQPDPEVLFIARNREKINAITFLPKTEIIELSHDKYQFNQRMREYEVPIPISWFIDSPETLKRILEGNKEKMWLRAIKGAGSLAALPVIEFEQAFNWIEYWCSRGIYWGQFMLSEYLPGKEFAFQSVWKEGKLFTSSARERIEYLFQNRMPSGQSSTPTIAKSVHNELVNRIATKAILALDECPHGIYCVDLKENKTGMPCVMEINVGRFFTTSYFFTVAGSNMPYYYTKLGCGDTIFRLIPKQYNAVPEGLYWIRQIDCGEILVGGNELDPIEWKYEIKEQYKQWKKSISEHNSSNKEL